MNGTTVPVETIHRTSAYCRRCDCSHEAAFERHGSDVWFAVDCPREPWREKVSDDAELFMMYRSRFNAPIATPRGHEGFALVNLLEVTNNCNFSCNFCYSSSSSRTPGVFRTKQEILAIAATIRREGAFTVSLTGGEPTLHPELPEIIRSLRRLGLIVNLISNGYLLGTDPTLARRIRKAGVACTCIQLDTLDPDIHRIHRGNDFVEEKKAAIRNCMAAGIRVILSVTVTGHNLDGIGELLAFARGLSPNLLIVSFLPLFKTGTVAIDDRYAGITRERIVKSIAASTAFGPVSPLSFWPLPSFAPLRIGVHPDCGAVAIVVTTPTGSIPLDTMIDMGKLYTLLGNYRKFSRGYWRGVVLLVVCVLRAAPKRCLPTLARAVFGFMTGRGSYGAVVLAVESFAQGTFQDTQRVERCATRMRSLDGINQNGCFVNRRKVWC